VPAVTENDAKALRALAGNGGGDGEMGVGVDDLQGLLLQVSLAIMMIFMIAFFMFRMKSEKEQQEQVMELTRQKLSLACDRVEGEYRTRYGLGVLMGTDESGHEVFSPDKVIDGASIVSDRTVKDAFREGGRLAAGDYAYPDKLAGLWRTKVVKYAELGDEGLGPADDKWLAEQLERRMESIRSTVYNVQRSCAARLQRAWLANPDRIGDPELAALVGKLKGVDETERLRLAAEISAALKTRSLVRLSEMGETELLP